MKTKHLYFFMVIACILVALLQGITPLYAVEHQTKVLWIFCIFLLYFAVLYWLKCVYVKQDAEKYENFLCFAIISFGIMLRCAYVLLSGLYDRQHDAGAFTGKGTDFINAGHIGYIEYIYKFHKLPQVNPYELFGYYHPPLHHIISCIWLQLNILLGVTEDLAFENLQVLTLLYSCLCLTVTYRILKLMDIKDKGLYIGLLFMALHPSTIIMAGSVNNDMLTMLFMCLTIYRCLVWIREKNLRNLLLLGLVLALGMITKLNSAVIALPVALVFLIHFIGIIRSRTKSDILLWVKNYCLFGLLTGTIGLSWIVRNLSIYGEKPGVPVPGETSPMYTAPYSLWQRLGIPSWSDWHFDFPFHPISAESCRNTWVIMFQTSLFTEEYPADANHYILALSQIIYVLALVLGLATAILFIVVMCKKLTGMEDSVFLLSGYIIMLLSFAAFVVIYPYTCSSDFRYVTICLLYIALGLGLGNKYLKSKWGVVCMNVINCGIIAVLAGTTFLYGMWNRW